MRRIHSLLGISITTEHVRAHQDDTVPLEDCTPQAVINIAMDKEAERIRVSSLPTPPIPIFSSRSAVAVLINNAVITDRMEKRIRHHITSRPLRAYLLRKNQWTDDTMDMIDWQTLEKYMNTVPNNKATNLVKLMHGWQFTTGRQTLMRTEEADEDTDMANGECPLGCGCREDDHHYLVCQKQPGATQMQREVKALKDSLDHSDTHPDMAKIIVRSYGRERTIPTMDHTHTTTGNDQGHFLRTAEDRMEASLSWPYQLVVEVYPAKMVRGNH